MTLTFHNEYSALLCLVSMRYYGSNGHNALQLAYLIMIDTLLFYQCAALILKLVQYCSNSRTYVA
jgi:hypothetical protein